MKILRIIARLNVGGPAKHVVWLTKEFSGDEFQSVLVAGTVPEGEEDMAYLADENGIRPIYIEEMSRELSPKDVVSLLKIYLTIKREKPDVIHTHTAKAGTVGRVAAFLYRWLTWRTLIGKPRKVRVIHTFHGHVFHSYYGKLKTKVFIVIERLLARIATDRIVVISRQQFDEIHRKFHVGLTEQFRIIPLGIDLSPFESHNENRIDFRNEIRAGSDDVIVGFVGRLTEIKNVSMLLRVATIYKRTAPDSLPKLKFVIIGDGHMRRHLEAEAAQMDLTKLVMFTGNRTDVTSIYAGLDIVALTSFNEGTPLSLIEAMASSRPVISTAVGGVVDLLGEVEQQFDGFNLCKRGVSVDEKTSESFARGLIYLAKNEKLRECLGARGLEFVQNQYSKERLVKDIKQLYRELKF